MVAFQPIGHWVDAPGELVSWDPSPVTLAKVGHTPVSPVPASYQQAQHLNAYLEHRAAGREMARLNVPSWNIPGRCDIRAMTYVINAYLRRHDTYHSWFERRADGLIVRRKFADPADIEFAPTKHGRVTSDEWQARVLATPNPLEWNCFAFGIIQRADHFTFYVSVDHLHADAMFMAALFVEIHLMYTALVSGAPPMRLPAAGSYDEYCLRQRQYAAALTLDSPPVRTWIEFAANNGGTLPRFPLPLGDPSVRCSGAMLTVQLLDEQQTQQFETICAAGDIRFSGGVLACAALAAFELTGQSCYHVITPTTTRKTPSEFMTTGWFTGVVPITVPIVETSFYQTARLAQSSFDLLREAANVPFERVLELAGPASGLRAPGPGTSMLSFLDAGLPPLSPEIIAQWNSLGGRVHSDTGAANQVGMWVNRLGNNTTLSVAFPDNPTAHESITRYVAVMSSVYQRVIAGQGAIAFTGDAVAGSGSGELVTLEA